MPTRRDVRTTASLPAVQNDPRVSEHIRKHTRFQIAFRVDIVADLLGFVDNVEDVVESAVQDAIKLAEKEQECRLRYVSVFYIPMTFLTEDGKGQYYGLLGHVLVEPIPGLRPLPKSDGRRKYT